MTYKGNSWIALIVLLCATICTAHAATITASPDQIDDGGTVQIDISDLQDGATFSLRMDANFAVSPSSEFSYSIDNFVLPITLKNAETTVHTQNARVINVNIKKGGTTRGMKGIADSSGSITTTLLDNISAGTYDQINLTGTAQADAETITTSVSMVGEKQGPTDSAISFTVNGLADGTVTVTVLVDGTEKLSKVVTIGAGTSTTTSSGDSEGGSGGDSETTVTTTPTPSLTVASVDGTVRLNGTGTDSVTIMNTKAEDVPAAWQALTAAYTLTPAGTTFSSKANLSFSIPATVDPETWTLFLARYDDGTWSQVPSQIEGDLISAEIQETGTYALMTFAPTTTATTSGTVTVTTTTTGQATAPQTSLPTTTQKSATEPLPVLGALIGLLYLAGKYKKE